METGQGKKRKKRCVCKCVLLFLTILLLAVCAQGCDRTDEKAKVEVSGEITNRAGDSACGSRNSGKRLSEDL